MERPLGAGPGVPVAQTGLHYTWFRADEPKGARACWRRRAWTAGTPPVVITEQGATPIDPPDADLAATLGPPPRPATLRPGVIGGGPAGLAAVYGAREGLDTVLIERTATGGQAGQSSIENYLAFPDGLSGAQPAERPGDRRRNFSAEVITAAEVVGLWSTATRAPCCCPMAVDAARAVILAMGVEYREPWKPPAAPI